MKQGLDKILINIEPELKKEFVKTCKYLGLTMTVVLTASIEKFIKETKQTK